MFKPAAPRIQSGQASATRNPSDSYWRSLFLFNVYDRLADAIGWDVPSRTSGYYQSAATRLLKQGYV